ncbi:MAG: M48 family metallopeptidase [Deltaproteobacteria bacterium]|nr:M48 family metallopeptidase [Deltaproteobacteria bacterium]
MTESDPEYRILTSPLGRNVYLRISARFGLTVVVPRGFDLRRLPEILEKKRNWIESRLRRCAEPSEAVSPAPPASPPDRIELPALGESWRVEYLPTRTRRIGVMTEHPGQLTVYGAVADRAACRAVLQRWLRRRTREELVPWLALLAEQGGFTFGEVLIRGQKTRWASCSSKGTIALSYKLLFLERRSVRYVLLHELCHTVHMNHSPRFWTHLSRFEPECRVLRRRMREDWKQVPAWVEEMG